MTKVFLDSNIIVYAFGEDQRNATAVGLLAEGGVISVQVLNEFVNVARRKLHFEWSQIEDALAAIRTLASAIHPIDHEVHTNAVGLAKNYGFSFYDALIVAAALKAKCTVLYSEDMQHGRIVEDQLEIRNPFLNV